MIRKLILTCGVLLCAPLARGDEVAQLEAAGGTIKSNYVPAGRSERFGHAEMLVAAPVDVVREQATDFGHYKDMSRGRITRSRLVDRRPGATDVYLQVPVLHGMITLWDVLRFSDVRRAPDGSQSFTGTLVRGNVRAAEMAIRIRPVAGGRSIVSCDLLVTPEFIAPQSSLDAELRDAAADVVHAFGGRAEQKMAQLTPPAPTGSTVAQTP